MIVDPANLRDDLVQQASQVLARGKGHIGVINMLTTQGLNNDEAVTISHDIFEDARLHLRRSQLYVRFVAWGLIIGLPLILAILTVLSIIDEDLVIVLLLVSGVPIFYGIRTLSKLPNPTRLPKNVTEQVAASDR